MNALVGKVRPGDFGVDVMTQPAQNVLHRWRAWPGIGSVTVKRALDRSASRR